MRTLRVFTMLSGLACMTLQSSCGHPAPVMPEGATSRCEGTPSRIRCSYQVAEVRDRRVLYQTPVSPLPAQGAPLVLLFQGTGLPPFHAFDASRGEPFGAYYQAELVHCLLDAGYVVVAPEAHYRGRGFWDTNVLPSSVVWDDSPDDRFTRKIFGAIARGRFGNVDASRLYATGISSGGYMTSRMAITFPTLWKAVAIQSASYATCVGLLCIVPAHLPDKHPPTLFLHGAQDLLVPISTMERYQAALLRQGVETKVVRDQVAGHAWIEAAPEEIVAFFDAHR